MRDLVGLFRAVRSGKVVEIEHVLLGLLETCRGATGLNGIMPLTESGSIRCFEDYWALVII